ncbi:hypothetical protein FB451DRAFT_1375923 [Mycena latifolia]|nr:hypothetical protein FB451DRAFT_1375923 [Mycena latifolia]
MDLQPALPVELEREIFEIAALKHRGTIPVLLRVARRTLIWIEPYLYRVVRINTEYPYSDMARAIWRIKESKPPSFFRDTVRHLALDLPIVWSVEDVMEVLQLCTRLDSFAPLGRFAVPAVLEILADSGVQRLYVPLMDLLVASKLDGANRMSLTHPFFSSITHLDILGGVEPWIVEQIPLLPALTHLGVCEWTFWHTVETLLVACTRLEVLVMLFPAFSDEWASDYAESTPIEDVRFVVTLYSDHIDELENDAHELPNFWSAAEDFVARKRSGDVAGFYCRRRPG